MTPKINPYRPVSIPSSLSDAQRSLVYDGVITEEDYVSFFPLRRSSLSLLRIMVTIVTVVTASMIGLVAWALATKGFDPAALSIVPAILLMAFLVAMLFWALRPQLRARRQLRHNRDLLGQAQGTADADGLTFFDGERTHWFSPSALAGVRAESNGIRVPLDQNPYRYLALTARLFDGYSETTATSLASNWNSFSDDPPDLRTFAQTALKSPQGPNWLPPHREERWIPFAGEITAQLPTKTPENRKRATIESASVLIALTATIITFSFGMRFIAIACLVPAVLGLVTSIRLWRSYLGNAQTQVWRQLGWISADEFVWRNESHGIRCSMDQIQSISCSDEMASLTFASGTTYIIPRQQVSDDEAWSTFADLLAPWQPSTVKSDGNEAEPMPAPES